MKRLLLGISMVFIISMLAACGSGDSKDETKDEADISGSSEELTLAHNLSEDHPVHKGLEEFAEKAEEYTDGELTFKILSNGVLGDEKEVIEQLQSGSVAMTKVSAGALESFAKEYSILSLPYIFTSDEHYHNVMQSDVVEPIYQSTEDQGFIGLTYYDSGARSFYTKDKAIMEPDDLKGLKIRVMDSPTAIEMVELMGGTSTSTPYGEIYTALQQGVVDGAESNPTALTVGKHGEVAHAFSKNEHTRIPDVLIVSTKVWEDLSEDQQEAVRKAAEESTTLQMELWDESVKEAEEEAEELGVEFYEPELEPFIEKVQPLHDEFGEDEDLKPIMNDIKDKE